jgi:uncharacterized membrane protein
MAGRSRYDNPFEEGGTDEVNPFAVRLADQLELLLILSSSCFTEINHPPVLFDSLTDLILFYVLAMYLPLLVNILPCEIICSMDVCSGPL